MSLQRYLVFGWDSRYGASGGWHDFIASYDSLDEAKQVLIKALPAQTNGQVVDTLAAEIVFDLEEVLLWRGFLSDLYDWRVVSLDEHEEELASRTAGVPVQDSFANSLPIAGPKGELP